MQPDEMESQVVEHLTEDFLTSSIRAIFAAREHAHKLCMSNFEPAEADNLRPLIARAKLNEYLRGVAARLPDCIAAVERSKGSSIKRTQFRSGPVSLTAHAVQEPCGPVKKYEYRHSLAQGIWPTLFDVEPERAADTLYVVLLHGPYRQRNLADGTTYDYLPGSIYIAFPTLELGGYAHRVNLVARYNALVNSLLPNEWDDQAKLSYRRWSAARLIG